MSHEELIQMLTDGLPAEQAATVRAAIERDTVKFKVSTLKAEKEYQDLARQSAELRAELEGDAASQKQGTRAYQKWYNDNIGKIRELETNYAKMLEMQGQQQATPPQQGAGMTEADVIRIATEKVLANYVPANAVAGAMEGQMNVLQKHFLSGRKTPVNTKELYKLAGEKYNGNLEAAYDEWDRPEREKAETAAKEAEIGRRVKEELQKRGASQHFPAGADLTPSALGARPKAEVEKFDRTAMARDLAETWMNGEKDTTVQ